VKQQ